MKMIPLSFIIVLVLQLSAGLHGAKWTYNGPDGEHHWSQNYPYCGGAFQSPIDIRSDLLRFDPSLRPIQVQNYALSPSEQLTLGNNGHSVQISLPSKMSISGLPHRYTAAQLHFHWGSSSKNSGSEHTVNGKQFAAELHVVHYNSDKYGDMSSAVDKSDGLAVLGVLMEVGEFNPAFEHFLSFISGIKYKDQRVQVPGFNVRALLPARLDEYYRYDGSLTTPPCYPSVLWTIFRNHVTMSHKQFLSLATALSSSHPQDSAPQPLDTNYRRAQLPDSRVVLVSFKEGRGLRGTPTVASPLSRKRVVQQLLIGDLADLADEDLHHLLPGGSVKKPSTSIKKKYEELDTRSWSKQHQVSKVSVRKKSRTKPWVQGNRALTQEALCFVPLEQKVSHQLRQSHSGQQQLVHALRDQVFPKLNLHSYLDCKSDLALSTVRDLLQRRRTTDEALELDQSLTKALRHQKKTQAGNVPTSKHGGGHSPVSGSRKGHGQGSPHPWLLPMEWED